MAFEWKKGNDRDDDLSAGELGVLLLFRWQATPTFAFKPFRIHSRGLPTTMSSFEPSSSPLVGLLLQPVLVPLVLSTLLLLPLTIYRVLHRSPSPTRKTRTRKFWFTMFVLVGPVWGLTPLSFLVSLYGLLATIRWGGFAWPSGTGARIAAGFGVGWAILEVCSSSFARVVSRQTFRRAFEGLTALTCLVFSLICRSSSPSSTSTSLPRFNPSLLLSLRIPSSSGSSSSECCKRTCNAQITTSSPRIKTMC